MLRIIGRGKFTVKRNVPAGIYLEAADEPVDMQYREYSALTQPRKIRIMDGADTWDLQPGETYYIDIMQVVPYEEDAIKNP